MATATETKPEALYEGMFLVESTRFANDPEKVTQTILGILEKAGATVVAHRPWQDGKLAYPINGRRKGLHYLTYFRMPGSGMKDIDRACRLNDTILRQLIIKHPPALFDAMVQAVTAPAEGEGEAEAAAEEAPAAESKESK